MKTVLALAIALTTLAGGAASARPYDVPPPPPRLLHAVTATGRRPQAVAPMILRRLPRQALRGC